MIAVLEEAAAAGREQGLEQGRGQGRAAGTTLGLATAVQVVLEARGIAVSEAQAERIRGCAEAEVLQDWLRRAAVVGDAAALFASAPA